MRPLLSVRNGHDLGSGLLTEVSTVARVQRHPNRILLLVREFRPAAQAKEISGRESRWTNKDLRERCITTIDRTFAPNPEYPGKGRFPDL